MSAEPSPSVATTGAAVGERLFALRDARGWSQTKLEEVAGISRITIGKLESGQIERPRIGTLRKLSSALGVGVHDLTGEPTPPKVPALRLNEMLHAKGAGRAAALKGLTKAERDALVREIDEAEAEAQREWATCTDPEERAELWEYGKQLHSLREEVRHGPAAIPVRMRERV